VPPPKCSSPSHCSKSASAKKSGSRSKDDQNPSHTKKSKKPKNEKCSKSKCPETVTAPPPVTCDPSSNNCTWVHASLLPIGWLPAFHFVSVCSVFVDGSCRANLLCRIPIDCMTSFCLSITSELELSTLHQAFVFRSIYPPESSLCFDSILHFYRAVSEFFGFVSVCRFDHTNEQLKISFSVHEK
jgi:hypothetical protein